MPNNNYALLKRHLLEQGEDPALIDAYFSEMGGNQADYDVPPTRMGGGAIAGPAPGSMRYAMTPDEPMRTYDPTQPMLRGTYSRSKFIDQPEGDPEAIELENRLMSIAGSFDPSDRRQRGMMDLMTQAAGSGDKAIMRGALEDYRQSQMERAGYIFGPYGGIFKGGKRVAEKPVPKPVDIRGTERGMRLKGEIEAKREKEKTEREIKKELVKGARETKTTLQKNFSAFKKDNPGFKGNVADYKRIMKKAEKDPWEAAIKLARDDARVRDEGGELLDIATEYYNILSRGPKKKIEGKVIRTGKEKGTGKKVILVELPDGKRITRYAD
ncbi:MAG: hypothetical protein SWO11_22525 [Thermodesulfobacteriota bacterium]|nr:hypothetical protein [Thermodesulfobacteriota bacterium]